MILVDEKDREIGRMEKIAAHKFGCLHRAFSIFIFNSKGEMLLQKRASSKYHSPGLWTNTTCSHPRPGESVLEAAHRRLREEMGFDTELEEIFSLVYKAEFDNGLTEFEYDHVLIGYYDGEVKPDPKEAEDWKWVKPEEIEKELEEKPEKFTVWFRIIFPKLMEKLRSRQ